MNIFEWLRVWWADQSAFVGAALLIAVMVLTWLASEWVWDHWRGIVGRFLLRREYGRMAREREAARRAVAQSSLAATANDPRAVARNYRVRASAFHGTTQLTMVPERGESGEEDK